MEGTPRILSLAVPTGAVLGLAREGKQLEVAERDQLLADVRAGKGPSRLRMKATTFLQTEAPNRNFVRFRAGALRKIAKTFVGAPFLRDHEQRDLSARGGKVIDSEFVGADGLGQIEMTIELVKPWAIEGALDGTIDRFSIGFSATDTVCSICEAPTMDLGFFGSMLSCQHQLGAEVENKAGTKRTVELLIGGGEGLEVSAVSVPAVPGTGIDDMQALAAAQRVRAQLARHQENPMQLMSKLIPILALATDASEDNVVAAVQKLKLDSAATATLLAAETEAHKATRAQLATAEGELGKVRAADREKTLASLREAVERKVGKGDASKPVMDVVLQLAEVSLEQAQAYVGRLAQVLPIGQPLQSRGVEPPPVAGELTAQQKRMAKAAGVTEEDYAKTLQAQREKEVA